ncbi:proline-rich protein 36-like [Hippopotamus amphibius kiboko]|uniref:proline-rich protein 36-like n=1 Tax=Hippopotamus amphibius kiboko TaxID=575201 RepID=UPI0025942EDF|nr:proline-rich protein 36-like [Hippopotamus amphibius kiboko]
MDHLSPETDNASTTVTQQGDGEIPSLVTAAPFTTVERWKQPKAQPQVSASPAAQRLGGQVSTGNLPEAPSPQNSLQVSGSARHPGRSWGARKTHGGGPASGRHPEPPGLHGPSPPSPRAGTVAVVTPRRAEHGAQRCFTVKVKLLGGKCVLLHREGSSPGQGRSPSETWIDCHPRAGAPRPKKGAPSYQGSRLGLEPQPRPQEASPQEQTQPFCPRLMPATATACLGSGPCFHGLPPCPRPAPGPAPPARAASTLTPGPPSTLHPIFVLPGPASSRKPLSSLTPEQDTSCPAPVPWQAAGHRHPFGGVVPKGGLVAERPSIQKSPYLGGGVRGPSRRDAGGPAVTQRCPRVVARLNSSRTPAAQLPGPADLRVLWDPSHPPGRAALARWGRGRGPTWSGGQERVTRGEQGRRPSSSPSSARAQPRGHRSLGSLGPAGPAGRGLGYGRAPRPGWHLGLRRRDRACGAREGHVLQPPSPWGGSPRPLCRLRGSPALRTRDKFSLPTLGPASFLVEELTRLHQSRPSVAERPSGPAGQAPARRRTESRGAFQVSAEGGQERAEEWTAARRTLDPPPHCPPPPPPPQAPGIRPPTRKATPVPDLLTPPTPSPLPSWGPTSTRHVPRSVLQNLLSPAKHLCSFNHALHGHSQTFRPTCPPRPGSSTFLEGNPPSRVPALRRLLPPTLGPGRANFLNPLSSPPPPPAIRAMIFFESSI